MLWTVLSFSAFASSPMEHHFSGVHMLHTLEPLEVRLAAPPPTPSKGTHTATVYGYMQGGVSMVSMVDLDSLTHVAWHAVGWDASGNITNTDSWEAVAPTLVSSAHAVGTRVHLNLMPPNSTHVSVLSNESRRRRAVEQLAALVNDYGADGVSIDIESMSATVKDELVRFTEEMRAAVDEVIVATPLIDWDYAYDYDELAAASDGLFIMGYDAHGPYEGSGAGPISMMNSGDYWPYWTLPYSLDEEYRRFGAPDDKIIMGLPLYGGIWDTPSEEYPVPAVAASFHNHWPMSDFIDAAEVYGSDIEEDSVSAYIWNEETRRQYWYDDPETLAVKMSWALSEGIQGIGFWEVSYATGEPDFWEQVDSLTMTDDDPEDDSVRPTDTGSVTDTGESEEDVHAHDTGLPSDDGGADAGTTTTEGTETPVAIDKGVEPDAKGCGCTSTPAKPEALWLLTALGALIGRRRT